MAGQMLCTNCGYQGQPERIIKGSVLVEIFLWLLFLLPGIIYSIWRCSTKAKVCPNCMAPNMIPLDSPVAQKFLTNK